MKMNTITKTLALAALTMTAVGELSAQGHHTVLLEEFSTAQCQYCPGGAERIAQAVSGRDDVIWIVHHAGFGTDDITTAASSQLTYLYGSGMYAPAMMVDRTKPTEQEPENGDSPVIGVGDVSDIEGLIDEMAAIPYPAYIDIENISFDPSARHLTARLGGMAFEGVDMDKVRLSVFVVEDSIVMRQANTTGFINDYVHMHAVRASLTGKSGDEVEFREDGSYNYDIDVALPDVMVGSHCRIVALLHYLNRAYLDRNQVLASVASRHLTDSRLSIDEAEAVAEVTVWPNPSVDRVNIKADKAIESLTVTDIAGKMVHRAEGHGTAAYTIDTKTWAPGVYLLHVATENGISLQKIVKQ